MKKILTFAFVAMCTLLMSIVCTSCHYTDTSDELDYESYLTTGDSATVENLAFMTVFSPVFDDVPDILEYTTFLREHRDFENILYRLTNQSIATICNVLTKNKQPITQQAFLEEYYKNRQIYDAIQEFNEEDISSLPSEPESEEYVDSGVPIKAYRAFKKGGTAHE